MQADVTDAAVRTMIELVERALGLVDVLVCNAVGIYDPAFGTLLDLAPEALETVVLKQLRAMLIPARSVLPSMVARQRGSVVVLPSQLARSPKAGCSAPSTAKGAIEAAARALAVECGPHGVRINTVAPGPTLTDAATWASAEVRSGWADRAPLRRNALANDVAGAVAFLASDAAGVHNRSTPDSRWWRGNAVTQPRPDGGLSAPVTLPGRPSHRATPSMTDMDITIQASFLPQDDPDAALAFYRDALGFEVRNDVGYGGMRWLTVGPADQPGMSIVLYPPGADPGITDDERRTIVEMMAKGTYAIITLATKNLDGTFEQLRASGAEVVQEPTEQPYGVRDCAFRDPAGNMVRINEVR